MYAMSVPVEKDSGDVLKPSEAVKPGNNHSLNLGSSRVEFAGNCVPQIALHLVLGHIAVTTVDLNRVETTLHARFTHVKLGHRRLAQRMPSLALQPGRLVPQQPSSFEANRHIGDLVADGGIFSDRLAELPPLPRIRHTSFLQPLHHAQMAGQDA